METLSKIFEEIKKFLAKEFLWALVALLLAFLLALITKWGLGILYKRKYFYALLSDNGIKSIYINNSGNIYINNANSGYTELEYFLALYIFYIALIYLIRMVASAIKTLKGDEEKEE